MSVNNNDDDESYIYAKPFPIPTPYFFPHIDPPTSLPKMIVPLWAIKLSIS